MTGNCDNTNLIPAAAVQARRRFCRKLRGPVAGVGAPVHKAVMAPVLILVLLLAAPAVAGPDRASLLVGSRHIDPNGSFEEVNPGLFLTWEGRRLDLSVGVYHNSYGRTSTAVTLALPLWRQGAAEVEAFAGLAHYPVNGSEFLVHAGDVVPLGGLQLRWRNLFGQVIPLDGSVADAVVTFGVTFRLD